MPKKNYTPHIERSEGFFTPRKQKVWISLGFIILFIGIYSLGTIMSDPVLKWTRLLILTILGLPIMIFEFLGVKQVPFAMTIIGLIAYLFYIYLWSCFIFHKWNRKKK